MVIIYLIVYFTYPNQIYHISFALFCFSKKRQLYHTASEYTYLLNAYYVKAKNINL